MDETPPAPLPKKKRWPFVVVISFLVLLGAFLVVPSQIKAKATACKNACVNNLRQLDGAKEQYALQKQLPAGHVLSAEEEKLVYEFVKGGEPKCPGGGNYKLNPIDSAPTCDSLREGGHSLAGR